MLACQNVSKTDADAARPDSGLHDGTLSADACRQLVREARTTLAEAHGRDPGGCTSELDCVLTSGSPCGASGLPIAITRAHESTYRAVLDDVIKSKCKAWQDGGCAVTTPVPIPSQVPYWTRCDHGHCAVSTTPPPDGGAPFQLTFRVVGGAVDKKIGFQGKLRITTSDGQSVDYKTPISHRDCYLLAGERSASVVEGDAGHLICAGGARIDEAKFRRTSETSIQVTFQQQDIGGPDSPVTKPINSQTVSIRVPRWSTIRTSFEEGRANE